MYSSSSVRRGRLGDMERVVDMVDTESESEVDGDLDRFRDRVIPADGLADRLLARPRSSSFIASCSSAIPSLPQISRKFGSAVYFERVHRTRVAVPRK